MEEVLLKENMLQRRSEFCLSFERFRRRDIVFEKWVRTMTMASWKKYRQILQLTGIREVGRESHLCAHFYNFHKLNVPGQTECGPLARMDWIPVRIRNGNRSRPLKTDRASEKPTECAHHLRLDILKHFEKNATKNID